MDIKERIVEVLAKYNVKLEAAPLDALAMAMERMRQSKLRRVDPRPFQYPAD